MMDFCAVPNLAIHLPIVPTLSLCLWCDKLGRFDPSLALGSKFGAPKCRRFLFFSGAVSYSLTFSFDRRDGPVRSETEYPGELLISLSFRFFN